MSELRDFVEHCMMLERYLYCGWELAYLALVARKSPAALGYMQGFQQLGTNLSSNHSDLVIGSSSGTQSAMIPPPSNYSAITDNNHENHSPNCILSNLMNHILKMVTCDLPHIQALRRYVEAMHFLLGIELHPNTGFVLQTYSERAIGEAA